MLLAKPVLWSQIIEEFYLRQGYVLYAEDGVDMQLLELAQQQEQLENQLLEKMEELEAMG